MTTLKRAESLNDDGLFNDALGVLAKGPIARDDRLNADLLRAELLERTGKYEEARSVAHAILRLPGTSENQTCRSQLILGRVASAVGDFDLATGLLQRATITALMLRDFGLAAWSQLRLAIMLFDESGPEAVGPLISQLRANAARSADPKVLAALHLHVAEIESKRSLLASAENQIALALKILEKSPNTWLLAVAEQHRANLSCLKLDFRAGIEHAERAVALSGKAGWFLGSATSAATLGNLFLFTGQLEQAAECCLKSLECLSPGSDNFSGILETLSRIRLLQGRLEDCDEILRRISGYASTENIRRRFVYRHTLLTRARALHQKGETVRASVTLEEAIRLAIETRDEWLLSSARLIKAQLLSDTYKQADLVSVFDALTRQVELQPIDRHAALEHAFASGLLAVGEFWMAHQHMSRARNIFAALEHRLGLLELAACPNVPVLPITSDTKGTSGQVTDMPYARSQALQDVAAVINHRGRSRLVANELLDLAVASGCVESAFVVCRKNNGDDEIVTSHNGEPPTSLQSEQRLFIGTEQADRIELVLRPVPHLESFANLKAIATIASALNELEHARTEREERASIWPTDELIVDGDSVISGHMRETMTLAQKVARTTVNVLITGESGTGKEIIARAIHHASARAQKPFVPFNCAAIPRELVESQLFGHRRGAFTGADRDYLGVIRAAREGTLFLDEIGSLSLDLQPKLLRFLESGEIAPLGDPVTQHVNVRIVAATNTHLEDAVRDGRFREDLFYRLNVVRLSLKPLRERRDEIPGLVTTFVNRAAKEFHKGRLEVAEETMERLLLYRWPGNVRQLQNELRRMVALAEPNSTLGPDLISIDILDAMPLFRNEAASRREMAVPLNDKLLPTLLRVECEMIKCALRDNQGKVDAVAKSLGISRKGLYLKRQRLGL